MTIGVTIGKFNPFHRGHDHLIRAASGQTDHLVVIVCAKPQQQVPGAVRAAWIREAHPEIEVIETPDDLPEEPEPWAERTLQLLGGRRPDIAFTSEGYGEAWAAAMGASHVAVDPARARHPVAGRDLRADLGANWQHLTPPAKAWFARRVCVTGVESSGTTTLARNLAEHYRTAWVPEYGRLYWEGRRYTPGSTRWCSDEFEIIASRQAEIEDDLARRANKVLICDTDPLATHVWHRRYMGGFSARVERIADARSYDLYLVTAPDFAFVQDGTRDGERVRHEMHEWLLEALEAKGRRFVILGGSLDDRMDAAREVVDPLTLFEPFE